MSRTSTRISWNSPGSRDDAADHQRNRRAAARVAVDGAPSPSAGPVAAGSPDAGADAVHGAGDRRLCRVAREEGGVMALRGLPLAVLLERSRPERLGIRGVVGAL